MSILKELGHLRIPLEDIKQATNNFSQSNAIGHGGYGMVYKGELLRSDGVVTMIATKLVDQNFSHAELEFLTEIKVLSSYKHVNIVPLIGFCDEHKEKILVQDFMTHGSLDRYLSSTNLTWLKRLQICLGSARGLSYLHNGLEGQSVLHSFVKSRTILLDKKWQARIAGLGLARVVSINPAIFVNDGFIGAAGYNDPAYLETGVITKESDVYSFGVVLFEVLCGREAYDTSIDKKPFLVPLARGHYEKGTLNQIIDPVLMEQMSQESLVNFSATAYQCLEKLRAARPTMNEIVQKLREYFNTSTRF